MQHSLLTIGKLCIGAGLALAASLFSGCATINMPEVEPITLEKIVELSKTGKDAQAIIADIKTSRTSYDVQASQYAKLSRDGVADAVLDFMQQGQLSMAERHGRREAYRDLWLNSWAYGGVWSPRPYGIYFNGRAYIRHW